MNSSIEQQIIEKIRILPTEKQAEILEYVEKFSEDVKPKKKKLMLKLEELRAKLPKDVFEGYPTDGSLNHDHYLYGSPKKEVK